MLATHIDTYTHRHKQKQAVFTYMLIKPHSFIYKNMLSWVLLTLFSFYFMQIQGTWLSYGSIYCEIIENDMIK